MTKLDPTGFSLVYSTLIHGSGPPTTGSGGIGIAVDGAGAAYVTGLTSSPTFPTTPAAFDRTFDAVGDAFVAKLDPSGASLVLTFGGAATIGARSR